MIALYVLAAIGFVALIVIGVPALIWWLDRRASKEINR